MDFNSHRLRFIKFTETNREEYVQLLCRREVTEYITGAPLTVAEANERFDKSLTADKGAVNLGFLAVYELYTKAFVGLGKIVPYDNNMLEVGYALHPEFWGMGYASEITVRLVRYVEDLGGSRTLIGKVNADNLASIAVLSKCGFELYRTYFDAGGLKDLDFVLRVLE